MRAARRVWMISIVLGIALKGPFGLLVVMTGKLWNAVVECTSSNVSALSLSLEREEGVCNHRLTSALRNDDINLGR